MADAALSISSRLEDHELRIRDLEEQSAEWKGSLRVIVWLNGIILALVLGLIVALFGWGLSHITLKAEFKPDSPVSQNQDAGGPVIRSAR